MPRVPHLRGLLALGAVALLVGGAFCLYCLSPFAVYHGIDICPPWLAKSDWHLQRIDWFVQEAGWEHVVVKHRSALIADGTAAVPALIDRATHGHNVHSRESAVLLLQKIGPVAQPMVQKAINNQANAGNLDPEVVRGRLLYALFVAFKDWDAFDHWLDYAESHGPFALEDSRIEYHIQEFWSPSMPEYAVKSGGKYVINPEFIEWCKQHRDELGKSA